MIIDLRMNYIREINYVLKTKYNKLDTSNLSSIEKVQKFMELIVYDIEEEKAKTMLPDSTNYLSDILKMLIKDQNYYKKHFGNYNTYNYEEYYHNQKAQMKSNAELALKRLSKLYDLAETKNIGYPRTKKGFSFNRFDIHDRLLELMNENKIPKYK